MKLSDELQWRGFVNQTTLKDLNELDKEKRAFYIGFDASADSQTVGNLAVMMFAKTFLRHGWKGVILAGGSTSLIGDPGGKDKERPLQDEKTIAHNVAKAEKQLKSVLAGHKFELVNNLDWTRDLKVLPFLRDIGKHFSMTPLVQRDYIANRLGEGGAGISYAEFSYTILQGYDYLHLFDTRNVRLQLGGSDQWGNCLSGVELVRKARGAEVDVITINLVINKTTGAKFGKSEEGAIWLDAKKTSPYKFYQFWLNVDDAGVEDYLKIYTELDKKTIDNVMSNFQQDRVTRLAQKTLAYEVTKLVHGKEAAETQKRIADVLFGGDDTLELGAKEFESLEKEFAVARVPKHMEQEDIVTGLVDTGLASSRTEARRFLESGAIYINNIKISAKEPSRFFFDIASKMAVVRRGKNSVALFKIK